MGVEAVWIDVDAERAKGVEVGAPVLEGNRTYSNRQPYGEPQLGKRGLYASIGGGDEGRRRQLALLWVLNLSDGRHSLLDVARRAAYPFHEIRQAADLLLQADLLEEVHA